MKNEDVTERVKSTDREPADGVQKSQETLTKPLAGCVHSPMGKGVTQIVGAVTMIAGPGNTPTLGPKIQPSPIHILRTNPKPIIEFYPISCLRKE